MHFSLAGVCAPLYRRTQSVLIVVESAKWEVRCSDEEVKEASMRNVRYTIMSKN